MKHIFTLAAAVVVSALCVLTSCEDKSKQKLDPNAMISLRPDIDKAAQAPTKANPEHLTPLEIVKQTAQISMYCKSISENPVSRGFSDVQRDTVNQRLLMWGNDIINEDTLRETFITAIDVVLFRGLDNPERLDTIAYIPNSVLREAEKRIRSAFASKDYNACYEIFDKAYTFTPITGAEWRELKARGEN